MYVERNVNNFLFGCCMFRVMFSDVCLTLQKTVKDLFLFYGLYGRELLFVCEGMVKFSCLILHFMCYYFRGSSMSIQEKKMQFIEFSHLLKVLTGLGSYQM